MDLREEDKGEGRTQGRGSLVFWDILGFRESKKIWKEEEGREERTVFLEQFC